MSGIPYTGFKVFKVTNIDKINKTITGTVIDDNNLGDLDVSHISLDTPLKVTFIKSTNLDITTDGQVNISCVLRHKF